MPEITGILRDYTYSSANGGVHPQIVFTPSGPGVAGSSLYFSKPIVCIPDPLYGTFSQTLYYTTDLKPVVWYTVTILWLNGEGVPVGYDELPGRLFVPTEGGNLFDLLTVGLGGPSQLWVTTSNAEPEGSKSGDLIWNTTTDDILRIL